MKLYHPTHPNDFKNYTTDRIREDFLVEKLFVDNELNLFYSFNDRIIFGGAVPTKGKKIELGSFPQLRAEYFLERREMGVINIGQTGEVIVDGTSYTLNNRDCLYIGMGCKKIEFVSTSDKNPEFYIASAPAHMTYPTVLSSIDKATPAVLGSKSLCNERTIYKYIFPEGIKSCQLVMGLTMLKDGSVWNTMPCHTHDRRMEVYLYLDIEKDNAVFHFMGEPTETRHILVNNKQAVISPSWSIHSGCGTRNYSFIWAMCGENQAFDDMDGVKTEQIR